MDDSKIVDLFFERDETAIKKASEKYGKVIRKIAFSIIEDEFLAQECENDAYLTAWNLIPPNEPRDYLLSFLSKITKNIALDKCRAKNSKKRHADIVSLSEELTLCIPSDTDVSSEVDARILGDLISKFLKKQKKETRIIFIRRYWYQDSITEIAKKMNLSENKVKTVLHRTRNKLKKYLTKEGYTV